MRGTARNASLTIAFPDGFGILDRGMERLRRRGFLSNTGQNCFGSGSPIKPRLPMRCFSKRSRRTAVTNMTTVRNTGLFSMAAKSPPMHSMPMRIFQIFRFCRRCFSNGTNYSRCPNGGCSSVPLHPVRKAGTARSASRQADCFVD